MNNANIILKKNVRYVFYCLLFARNILLFMYGTLNMVYQQTIINSKDNLYFQNQNLQYPIKKDLLGFTMLKIYNVLTLFELYYFFLREYI